MKQLHRFAHRSEIPEKGFLIRTVNKRSVGVMRLGDRFIAVLNHCPHAGAPVCQGQFTGTYFWSDERHALDLDKERPVIRCPWHGWEFDVESGAALFPSPRRLAHLETTLEDDHIYIRI